MPLQTTVVGAWPKPEYLALPDWFKSKLAATGGKCSWKYHIPKILKIKQKPINTRRLFITLFVSIFLILFN